MFLIRLVDVYQCLCLPMFVCMLAAFETLSLLLILVNKESESELFNMQSSANIHACSKNLSFKLILKKSWPGDILILLLIYLLWAYVAPPPPPTHTHTHTHTPFFFSHTYPKITKTGHNNSSILNPLRLRHKKGPAIRTRQQQNKQKKTTTTS